MSREAAAAAAVQAGGPSQEESGDHTEAWRMTAGQEWRDRVGPKDTTHGGSVTVQELKFPHGKIS